MENEIWKDVFGYENRYLVNKKGDIYSLKNKRILKQQTNHYGYFVISISNPKRTLKIHRIVALAFIPNTENKAQVNHINGIKKDNRVENLEWNTLQENVKHAFENGLMSWGDRKSKNGLTNHKVSVIKRLLRINPKTSLKNISIKYGISYCIVKNIKYNKNWKKVI